MPSWTHVLAVVAGAARGDTHTHFGSLLGFDHHLAAATRLGLVQPGPSPEDSEELTDAGREFVAQYRIEDLPPGRANHWREELTAEAEAELERRWAAAKNNL